MDNRSKPIVWLAGEIKTPPFGVSARREAGFLLRMLQEGESLSLPRSRPMPTIGTGCHELRIRDKENSWRIIYAIEASAILVLDVFAKSSETTPDRIIGACRQRLAKFRRDFES